MLTLPWLFGLVLESCSDALQRARTEVGVIFSYGRISNLRRIVQTHSAPSASAIK